MGYIERHGVKFYNGTVNGFIYKMASPSTDSNIGYIMDFDDADDVLHIMNDLQLAINENFSSISNTDITTDNYIASISPVGVLFYSDDGQEIIETVPLQDIYDIAVAWRIFLLEPPLNGTTAK